MKTVFAALNAKYIHTALGARSVAAYARAQGVGGLVLWERTVNHPYRLLLRELAALEADAVVFSCYIWNIELMKRLAADLRTIAPGCALIAAGPEASYRCAEFLFANTAFDYIIAGEGEEATTAFLRELAACEPSRRRELRPRAAAVWDRSGREQALPAPPLDLDTLQDPYGDLTELGGRIIYYESMRGCPFRCAYCISSIDAAPVRFRSLEPVFADLQRFLDAGVRQVKFVDRTFNCDAARAREIWRWLGERDNGETGFHFELAGELLDEESLALLATLRPGLVQFEIGVQSTNPETLAAVHRPANLERLANTVRRLQAPGNIHLHLDLIAGLPREDFASFRCSFNEVYALQPEQLQLGFLKVLRGSAIERDAARYGIRRQSAAPYEVLATNCLTFAELSRLHGVADMVELYCNSGRFSHLVADICREFSTPFDFYAALAEYYNDRGYDAAPPSKVGYYDVLGGFMKYVGIARDERRQWLCRYDMALHEKPKRAPAWVEVDGFTPHRARILDFLSDGETAARLLPQLAGKDPKHIVKVAHVEVFPFDPATGAQGECALLFDYGGCDPRRRAKTQIIAL